jgi:hypothetical protein
MDKNCCSADLPEQSAVSQPRYLRRRGAGDDLSLFLLQLMKCTRTNEERSEVKGKSKTKPHACERRKKKRGGKK